MPWQNATISINHNIDDIIGIIIEWKDTDPLAEFGTTPYVYQNSRVDKSTAAGRNAFKAAAEAARDAERQKIQKMNNFKAAILTFMNT